jgi:hypothetical protein
LGSGDVDQFPKLIEAFTDVDENASLLHGDAGLRAKGQGRLDPFIAIP